MDIFNAYNLLNDSIWRWFLSFLDYNSYQLPVGPVSPDLARSKRGGGSLLHPSTNGSCARYDLFVDFERIGWSAWIISPKGYNAFQCRGSCLFPLGQNQRPTNHATVQSIVRELGMAATVQNPCCVPDRLLSISLLYFDENENVILKQYDDMVAAGCGCHWGLLSCLKGLFKVIFV